MRVKFILLFTTCFLVFTACEWEDLMSVNNTLDYNLQGIWVSNNPDSIYSGRLEITNDRITITGYGESQTPVPGGNDVERPFRDFTKGIALNAYSEDGHIFIEDAGLLQAGIPYIYWEESSLANYGMVEFLRFEFGGRPETLRKS